MAEEGEHDGGGAVDQVLREGGAHGGAHGRISNTEQVEQEQEEQQQWHTNTDAMRTSFLTSLRRRYASPIFLPHGRPKR